jgi:hypothetical protein
MEVNVSGQDRNHKEKKKMRKRRRGGRKEGFLHKG